MATNRAGTGISALRVPALALLVSTGAGHAGQTDQSQTPNSAAAGIVLSLDEQVGPGRGDIYLPNSSAYLIARDPFRSIRRGRQLFQRKFTLAQGSGPRAHGGVGGHDDIQADPSLGAGLADSCAACHGRPLGAAGFGGEVFTRPDSRDSPHLFGLGIQEMLADEMTQRLRRIQTSAIRESAKKDRKVRRRMRAKGIDFGYVTAYPDGRLDRSEIDGVDPDLRIKPFFAQGSVFSIRHFVVAAFDDEMGLEAVDPDLAMAATGAVVTTPSGLVLDGSADALPAPVAGGPNEDPDGDGVTNEIDTSIVDHMEFYLLNYFRPATYQQTHLTDQGRFLMDQFQCTTCHKDRFRIRQDRRVADVVTGYEPGEQGFNGLYATAVPLFHEQRDDPSLPPLRQPAKSPFVVRGIFTDFKRHDLGPAFWERNFDGTITKQFMTEPLWGVGSTPPYGHDGRSINLQEVILRHGGEAQSSRDLYAYSGPETQSALRTYLESLVLFPPDHTASNLNPADPTHPDFPQAGHGSIRLGTLFVDPDAPE